MDQKHTNKLALTLVLVLATLILSAESSLNFIGINYGTKGNNLPRPGQVIKLYKRINVGKVRLIEPGRDILEALRRSEIEVSIGVRNEDLKVMASKPAFVTAWIESYIEPYLEHIVFSYITVGNKVIPGSLGQYVAPVMKSFQSELTAKGLAGIKVTTVLPASVLSASFPPSAGKFSAEAVADIRAVLRLLSKNGSPLMINVYPYFAYASNPNNIRLDYAQFTAPGTVVQDGPLGYKSLFEAMVDSFVWAMEKEGIADVDVVVSETGWPSAGNGALTTPNLASTYNKHFVSHIEAQAGTPKRPGAPIEGYIFATFNENYKSPGVEQNFGLFRPDMTPIYPVF